jgi:anti-anti-sigma factor
MQICDWVGQDAHSARHCDHRLMNQPTVLVGACRLMLSDRCVSFVRNDSVVAGVRETAGVTEVWLRGDIDLATRSDMVDEVSRLFDRDGRVIRVDLAEVRLVDAGGIGACLTLQREARACGCDLVFTNPRGIVARVIDLLGLESVLLGVDRRG